MTVDEIPVADVLAAAVSGQGLLALEARTGVSTTRLAMRLDQMLDDPAVSREFPREVRVLRWRREERRQRRRAHIAHGGDIPAYRR